MDFLHQIISEELIYALGWTVLHSLWQGLLVAVIMAFVFQALQEKSAKIRYEVASFSLFVVFVLSLCTFLVLYDSVEQYTLEALINEAYPLFNETASSSGILIETIQQSMATFNQYLPLVVSVWLMGALFFSFRLLGGIAYVHHLKQNNNELLPAFWQKQMKQLARKLQLRKSVDLLESGLVKVPLVIGYFKPAILMPLGAINALSEKEVEAILAHELAHIARNDYLFNILLSFIEVLFYYHPAVWWISANVRLERENCCDDIAVKLCGNSLTYVKALVHLQEINRNHVVPSFAMPFSGSKNQLLNRVQRILNQPQNRSNIMEKMTATTLLVFTLAFLSISGRTPMDHKTSTFDLIWESIDMPENSEVYLLPNDEDIIAEVAHQHFVFQADTIPPTKKARQRIVKTEDGKTIDITMEEGTVHELIIDGDRVEEEDLEEYETLIEEMVEEFSNIPPPPPPPPAPHPFDAPAPPPPPRAPDWDSNVFNLNKTVRTRTGDNGETIIVIEGVGKESMEIVVQADENMVVIDGNSIKSGDTMIIKNDYSLFSDDVVFPSNITVVPDFEVEKWEKEDFKELMESIAEQKEAFKLAHKERMKEWTQSTKEQREAAKEKIKSMFKEQKVHMEELKNHMKQLKKEQWEKVQEQKQQYRELFEEQMEREIINETEEGRRHLHTDVHFENEGHFDSGIRAAFEEQLLIDGLITDVKDYKLELSGKKLKVNGDKKSKDLHNKYKAIYENLSGYQLHKKSMIKVKSGT